MNIHFFFLKATENRPSSVIYKLMFTIGSSAASCDNIFSSSGIDLFDKESYSKSCIYVSLRYVQSIKQMCFI